MQALLLAVTLFLAPDDSLPGASFVQGGPGLVLRAGPSTNHVGVLTLDAATILRAQPSKSGYRRVYLAQGFPVYLHGQFAQVIAADQQVQVTGNRVNLRLLPSAVGHPPVGQVDAGVTLQLLDEEYGWVRVLAPVDTALYAAEAELTAPAGDPGGPWSAALGRREARRQQAVAAFRATDAQWQAFARAEAEVASAESVDVMQLSEHALTVHAVALDDLVRRADQPQLRERIDSLQRRVEAEYTRRRTTQAQLEEVRRQQAREAARIVQEARALDMGLRFLGRGDELVVEGRVSRQTSADGGAAVYSIRDATGRAFKLSAAAEVAQLAPLLDRTVVLEGRSLPIVNVAGPVLIVDRVARIAP